MCSHEGGTCQIHGEGAQLKWRPGKVNVVGADGVNRLEYQRTYYYESYLGPAIKKNRGYRQSWGVTFGRLYFISK